MQLCACVKYNDKQKVLELSYLDVFITGTFSKYFFIATFPTGNQKAQTIQPFQETLF